MSGPSGEPPRRPFRAFSDLEVGGKVGRYNRLKEHVPFSVFLKGYMPSPAEGSLYISAEEAAGLDVDLSGSRVVLARVPRLPPQPPGPQVLMPSLALILLGNMLKARGARVELHDLHPTKAKDPHKTRPFLARETPEKTWRDFLVGRPSPKLSRYVGALADALRPEGASLVGLSVETLGGTPLALCLAHEIRRRFSVPVVVGGRGLTLPAPLFDLCRGTSVIFGEGEVPIILLADALAGRRPLDQVPGLLRWDGDRPYTNLPLQHDLDARAPFDLEGAPLDGNEDELLKEGTGPIVPYQFNMGCPFFCGFCSSFSRRVYRLRSPENVVRDLARAVDERGVRRFYMVNHLLNCDQTHLLELLDRMEAAKLKIHWVDCARLMGMTPGILRRLRKVGASRLIWGLDCGSERMSRLMRKGVRLGEARNVLQASHEAGITNNVNLIVGMPHETDQDVDETIRLIEKIRPYVTTFNIAPYYFFPLSPLGLHPEEFGLKAGVQGGVDEPGGPTWQERQARTTASWERIRRVINPD